MCVYVYEHTVLSLHYILTCKIHIKTIIEIKISLCMWFNTVIMNDITSLLNI